MIESAEIQAMVRRPSVHGRRNRAERGRRHRIGSVRRDQWRLRGTHDGNRRNRVWRTGCPNRNRCDYLKLDVQGAEHEILSAVPDDLWEGLAGVEVECRFRRHYAGQRHALDVVDLVRVRGFEVATLHPVFRGGQVVDRRAGGPATARTLSHADVLCVRPIDWPETTPDPRRAAAALLLVHAVHGLWQEAREVASCYLPELSGAVQACLPRDESPVSWRLAVLVRALQLVVAPSRSRRFDLADEALRVEGPSSSWRLSAPKL